MTLGTISIYDVMYSEVRPPRGKILSLLQPSGNDVHEAEACDVFGWPNVAVDGDKHDALARLH